MIEIRHITENKKDFLPLLLLADEQEDMIDRYLDRGDLYALYDDGILRTTAVVTAESADTCELKSLATEPAYQGQGYGGRMVAYLFIHYAPRFGRMLVGTGDVPSSRGFYEHCGFRESHRVKDFFTKHYDHPIYEDGILLTDMLYLSRDLGEVAP